MIQKIHAFFQRELFPSKIFYKLIIFILGKPVMVNVSYSVLGFRDIQEVDMVSKIMQSNFSKSMHFFTFRLIMKSDEI